MRVHGKLKDGICSLRVKIYIHDRTRESLGGPFSALIRGCAGFFRADKVSQGPAWQGALRCRYQEAPVGFVSDLRFV